jgi:hypothetical protein
MNQPEIHNVESIPVSRIHKVSGGTDDGFFTWRATQARAGSRSDQREHPARFRCRFRPPKTWLARAPVKTGEVSRMKEPYGEGVATHTAPESCAVDREVGGEALTGVRAGWAMSREIHAPRKRALRGCRRRELRRKATPPVPLSRGTAGPRAVERPQACTETPRTGTGRSHARLPERVRQAASGSPRT